MEPLPPPPPNGSQLASPLRQPASPLPQPSFGSPASFLTHNPTSSSSAYRRELVSGWEIVETKDSTELPCQRSLHAGAVWKDSFVVFGGYDGFRRVNDLYAFDFKRQVWGQLSNQDAPSPRDRHVAVVHESCLYIFGGFDGVSRVNDLHSYDLETNEWKAVVVAAGHPPTPRHSHSAVIYQDAMYIFGGYDGSYRSDFHAFSFLTKTWRQIHGHGDVPRARYRGTCVVCGNAMILHGGHDGNRHLQDTHIYDFSAQTWSMLVTEGPIPSPRDSHVAVIYGKSMFLYGGSTGSAMGDFHELKLEFRRVWSPVVNHIQGVASHNLTLGALNNTQVSVENSNIFDANSTVVTPGARFCHVGVVYENYFYVFGGYDGSNRLNDFLRFKFDDSSSVNTPPSTIISDLKKFVNCEILSDIQFIVEGRPIYAHKILCLRCPYFHNMLTGEYMESRASSVVVEEVKYSTFELLMEYLYTDDVQITMETAMELFQVADRFTIDRLKSLCEQEMLNAIDIETAAHILFTADMYNAKNLREKCLSYILQHFDRVSRTEGFEEMGRTNVDLIFEILKRR